jgi:HPt (histidine-containing phosphotransfer) domain-containing protein
VIVSAAVVPGPPLLAPQLGGADGNAEDLRRACLEAVAHAIADEPDLVAVVGAAATSAVWPSDAQVDLAGYGVAVPPTAHVAPLSVGMACLLLDTLAHPGRRLIRTIAIDAPLDECRALASVVGHAARRVGLIVVADGSARRTVKAPGYFDERAESYDARVEQAISSGDLTALHDLDPTLAAELMASGWAALQVLAFAVESARSTLYYTGAPFGVGYLAAELHPGKSARSGSIMGSDPHASMHQER